MRKSQPTLGRNSIVALFVIAVALAPTGCAQSYPIPAEFQNGTPALQAVTAVADTPGYPFPQPPDPPLPSSLPLQDYEQLMYYFLNSRAYTEQNWAYDREVRDTGPYILNTNYGTHSTVRIYYSPEVLHWLANGRRGTIPDGAMIIKEQFKRRPAAYYNERRAGKTPAEFQEFLESELASWAVLVKDESVSHAGWFWLNPGVEAKQANTHGTGPFPSGVYPVDGGTNVIDLGVDDPVNTLAYPNSQAGQGTCLRCHASAASEITFASLDNIVGFEGVGEPLRFRVDNSWRAELSEYERPAGGQSESDLIANYFHVPGDQTPQPPSTTEPLVEPTPDWKDFFAGHLLSTDRVQTFPGQWADHVPVGPEGTSAFITSDMCLGCHGGLGGVPYGVTMFLKTSAAYGDGYNISEFGEWRWSPMGLAGRDPIFFAQLESEFAILAKNAADGLFPASQLRELQQATANTCLSCHGAMGQRQLEIDHAAGEPGIEDANFYLQYINLTDPLTTEQEEQQKETMVDGLEGPHSVFPYNVYGNLAREGISCTVCHHIAPPTQWTTGMTQNQMLSSFLMNSTTGVFPYNPFDQLYGPFDDIRVKPMEHSLGTTPVQAPVFPAAAAAPVDEIPYIEDSKVCGTCHVINLPNVDAPTDRPLQGLTAAQQALLNQAGRNGATGGTNEHPVPLSEKLAPFQHSVEQGTYLEWENSAFAWDDTEFQSCQDCHMPRHFQLNDVTLPGHTEPTDEITVDPLQTQIATIQDSNYPESTHTLPAVELDVPVRDNYRRHELVGLNVFLEEMFDQFDEVLMVDRSDYETSATNGNELAIRNMQRAAKHETVELGVSVRGVDGGLASVEVSVASLVGHKFPSGVGFRRAFLEVALLREGRDTPVWVSGATNEAGVILGANSQPLPSEKLPKGVYQPHYQTITSPDQVQIYEELTQNAAGEFTTSFIHRDTHPKDNRLLPKGYLDPASSAFRERFTGDGTGQQSFDEIQAFMQATKPEGRAAEDPDFQAGSDVVRYEIQLPADYLTTRYTVRATMYSQAIPPYYLLQRFTLAPDGPATQRLYELTSRLNTVVAGSPIREWKLPLTSASAPVPVGVGGGGFE